MLRALFRSIQAALREFLLLENAQRRVSSLPESQRQRARAYRDAAVKRLAVSRVVRAPDLSPVGLSLYRDSLHLMALAFLASDQPANTVAQTDPSTAFEALGPALQAHGLSTPSSFGSVKSLLTAPDPIAFDNLEPSASARAREDLEATARWLSRLIEVRSPREFVLARRRRLAAVVACGLGVLWWLGDRLALPQNLALHKLARSSEPVYETAPYGAVDGEMNPRFGFHSAEADSPWLTIDLGKSHHLSSIKVYGRSDCCFDQSVPLALEVSADGESFQTIALRTKAFSVADPWIIEPEHVVTRFVRLRAQRRTVLVLTEVEVYGHLW